MLTTGWNGNADLGDTETFVVPSQDQQLTRCQPQPFQTQYMYPLTSGTGDVIKILVNDTYRSFAIVCGGFRLTLHQDACYLLSTNSYDEPRQIAVMRQPRVGAASVAVLNGTTLWVTGGMSVSILLDSTELIKVQSLTDNSISEEGIPLPGPMQQHCLEIINRKTAILYGGITLTASSSEAIIQSAWTIENIDTMIGGTTAGHSWSQEATMSTARFSHICGVIRMGNSQERKFVVAAGGEAVSIGPWGYESIATLNNVELLQVDFPGGPDGSVIVSGAWQAGPNLTITLSGAASATPGDQSVLYVAGGVMYRQPFIMSKDIFSLRCSDSVCSWSIEDRTLLFERSNGLAFILPPNGIPDESDCKSKQLSIIYFHSEPFV